MKKKRFISAISKLKWYYPRGRSYQKNQSSKIKQLNKAYFSLVDTFHQAIGSIKGIKTIINRHRQPL